MKTKSLNSNLHDANKAKKDEFYTQLTLKKNSYIIKTTLKERLFFVICE